jgi:hypothetical protein
VTLDAPNSQLIADLTDVAIGSTHTLGIEAVEGSNTYLKLIYLMIVQLESGEGMTAEQIAMLAMLLAALLLLLMLALLGGSIGNTGWSMVNQLQLYLLLPLVGVDLPDKILDFVFGLEMSMFSFDFLPSQDIFGVKNLIDYLDFEQSNDMLPELGIESGSTLVNQFSLIIVFVGVALVNL